MMIDLPNAPATIASRYPGFSSFKTLAPIHYPRRWHRDALIQATLNGSIRSLRPCQPPHDPLGRFKFVADYDGSSATIIIGEVPVFPMQLAGTVFLSRETIAREPFFGAGRAIWRHKHTSVSFGERLRLHRAVECSGRCPLASLVDMIGGPEDDRPGKVLALVANGLLAIELAEGLHPNSNVTLGPAGKLMPLDLNSSFVTLSSSDQEHPLLEVPCSPSPLTPPVIARTKP